MKRLTEITDAYPMLSNFLENAETLSKFNWLDINGAINEWTNEVLKMQKGQQKIRICGLSKCGFLAILIGLEAAKKDSRQIEVFCYAPLISIDMSKRIFKTEVSPWVANKLKGDQGRLMGKHDLTAIIPDKKMRNFHVFHFSPKGEQLEGFDGKQADLVRNNENFTVFDIATDSIKKHFKISNEKDFHRLTQKVAILDFKSLHADFFGVSEDHSVFKSIKKA